jgi:altronate hydrolase
MTTANTKHAADPFTYKPYNYHWQAPDVSKFKNRTFNGYHRKDGRVGTANYWLFMPMVFCENRNLDVIVRHCIMNWAMLLRINIKVIRIN